MAIYIGSDNKEMQHGDRKEQWWVWNDQDKVHECYIPHVPYDSCNGI
jgi:hypothetical protein